MKERIYYCFEYDDLGYIKGYYSVDESLSYDFCGDINEHQDLCEGWYKFVNNDFVVDEQKKAEIIAEREKEAQKPTWQETMDAQVTYTAMMTDTILEE